jgi:hypothetical protein
MFAMIAKLLTHLPVIVLVGGGGGGRRGDLETKYIETKC